MTQIYRCAHVRSSDVRKGKTIAYFSPEERRSAVRIARICSACEQQRLSKRRRSKEHLEDARQKLWSPELLLPDALTTHPLRVHPVIKDKETKPFPPNYSKPLQSIRKSQSTPSLRVTLANEALDAVHAIDAVEDTKPTAATTKPVTPVPIFAERRQSWQGRSFQSLETTELYPDTILSPPQRYYAQSSVDLTMTGAAPSNSFRATLMAGDKATQNKKKGFLRRLFGW